MSPSPGSDVPESHRREGLHHLVQRLLRAVPLPPLQVHPYRGEKPVYLTWRNNDLLWCFGTSSRAVHCSVAVVLVSRPSRREGPPASARAVAVVLLVAAHLACATGHAPGRRRLTTRSTARDVIAPTGRVRPGACPRSPGRSAPSFVSRVDGSSSSGCPASPRRRSMTRPWPTFSLDPRALRSGRPAAGLRSLRGGGGGATSPPTAHQRPARQTGAGRRAGASEVVPVACRRPGRRVRVKLDTPPAPSISYSLMLHAALRAAVRRHGFHLRARARSRVRAGIVEPDDERRLVRAPGGMRW